MFFIEQLLLLKIIKERHFNITSLQIIVYQQYYL